MWIAVMGVDERVGNSALVDAFKNDPIHEVLAVCAELRLSVDISVS